MGLPIRLLMSSGDVIIGFLSPDSSCVKHAAYLDYVAPQGYSIQPVMDPFEDIHLWNGTSAVVGYQELREESVAFMAYCRYIATLYYNYKSNDLTPPDDLSKFLEEFDTLFRNKHGGTSLLEAGKRDFYRATGVDIDSDTTCSETVVKVDFGRNRNASEEET